MAVEFWLFFNLESRSWLMQVHWELATFKRDHPILLDIEFDLFYITYFTSSLYSREIYFDYSVY